MNFIKRQSNLELLRILAMFLIVAHHFAVHGGGQALISTFTFNHFWTEILSMGGKVGVNLFVLITGYFCIRSIPKFSSIVLLWVSTLFYSLIIYLIFVSLGKSFSIFEFLKVLCPFTSNRYWFITCYVALIFITPFINLGIKNLNRKQYISLLLLIVFLWSLIPSVLIHPSLAGNKWYFSSLGWFVFLYLTAGFVRLYFSENIFTIKSKYIYLVLAFGITITILWIAFCNYQYSLGNHSWNKWRYFSEMNNIATLAISISIFTIFLRLKIQYSVSINLVASTMLGVYLIHDNNFVRPWLWRNFWNVQEHLSLSHTHYVIWSIAVILATFAVCIGIELLRQKLFQRPNLSIKNKVSFIDQKIKDFFSQN